MKLNSSDLKDPFKTLISWMVIFCLAITMGTVPAKAGHVYAENNDGSQIHRQVFALGENHSAVIKSDGKLYTWGLNSSGQLGDRTATNRTEPVAVYGLENVVSVSLGANHSAALTSDGSLYTWGNNEYGQLGYSVSGTENRKPHLLMTDVVSVSLGTRHSAAVTSDGSLYVWGSNNYGAIGVETTDQTNYQSVPVKVMENIETVALGEDCSAAITRDGDLYMWGYNPDGQVGSVENNDTNGCVPIPAKVDEKVKSVSFGYRHTLIVKSDGGLWAWGGGLYYGDLTGSNIRPAKIMNHVQAADACVDYSNGGHDAVVRLDGSLWLFGENGSGQIGDSTTTDTKEFQKLMDAGTVNAVGLGRDRSAALLQDGSLWMWGKNGEYNLNLAGDVENQMVPAQIFQSGVLANADEWTMVESLETIPTWDNDSPVTSIAVKGERSAAIKADGSLWSWGGLIPTGNYLTTPTLGSENVPKFLMNDIRSVTFTRGVIALQNDGTLWEYSCLKSAFPLAQMEGVREIYAPQNSDSGQYALVKNNGEMWMWGSNNYGQLGDGTTESKDHVKDCVKVLDNVKAVSIDFGMSAAITENGDLFTWGKNYYGQIGNGKTEGQTTPVKILENVKKVSIGNGHCAAMTKDGKLYAWGLNDSGQLGIDSNENQSTPMRVEDWEDVTNISLGAKHSAAVRADGSLWIWGDNYHYQLGLAGHENTRESVPNKVNIDNVKEVALFQYMSSALTESGDLYIWGDTSSSIGNGSSTALVPYLALENVLTYKIWTPFNYTDHIAAIRTDGSLWMWGCNSQGQVGNGTKDSQGTPVQIYPSDGSSPQVNDKDLTYAQITLDKNTAEYTGAEIQPNVTVVSHDGKTLQNNADYTVAYSDNVNAGMATITVTGKGDYTGSIEKSFRITAVSISGAVISKITDQEYTGEQIRPVIKVTLGEMELQNGRDYTVSYEKNIEVGTAAVIVNGTGNYSGKIQSTFEIKEKKTDPIIDPESKRSIETATVSASTSKVYTGKPIRPAVKVTMDGKELTEGTDYTITYKNNKNSGMATIVIEGIGDYNGTITKTFKIKKRKIGKTKIKISKKVTYTGKKAKPRIKITYGGKTLKRGTDYTVVCRSKKVGKAKVTIKGKGNFSGKKLKSFKIIPDKFRIKKVRVRKPDSFNEFEVIFKSGKLKNPKTYHCQISTSKKFTKKQTGDTYAPMIGKGSQKGKLWFHAKCKKGKTYYIRICAVVGSGKKMYQGPWSKAIQIKAR